MPKQDRGTPAHPPWLPAEDQQHGFLRSLRRKKRYVDDPESNEGSLAHEAGRTYASNTSAHKPTAESVLLPVDTRAAAPREDTANGTSSVPDISKYYTPPRAPEPPAQRPLPAESNEIVAKSVPGELRIITSPIPEIRPEPQPISQVEQPQVPVSDESPAIPAPEPAAPRDVADSLEPTPAAEPPAESSSPAPTADQRREESAGTDPFSRFSLLEAQLRQMSLDESITDAELERHRRHAMPESEVIPAPEACGALSFTSPEGGDGDEVVEDIAGAAQVALDTESAGAPPEPALGFTLPEALDQSFSETEEPEPAAAVPDAEPDAPAVSYTHLTLPTICSV